MCLKPFILTLLLSILQNLLRQNRPKPKMHFRNQLRKHRKISIRHRLSRSRRLYFNHLLIKHPSRILKNILLIISNQPSQLTTRQLHIRVIHLIHPCFHRFIHSLTLSLQYNHQSFRHLPRLDHKLPAIKLLKLQLPRYRQQRCKLHTFENLCFLKKRNLLINARAN